MDVEQEVSDAAGEVAKELGGGFTESVYHRALEMELASRGVTFSSEGTISVFYKGNPIGRRRPDLFVRDGSKTIVVELKAGNNSGEEQLLQYIDMLGDDANFDIWKGMLINFEDDGTATITTETVQ